MLEQVECRKNIFYKVKEESGNNILQDNINALQTPYLPQNILVQRLMNEKNLENRSKSLPGSIFATLKRKIEVILKANKASNLRKLNKQTLLKETKRD